jgi:hypothetical protein
MIKLSLKELDEALSNPVAYRAKITRRQSGLEYFPPSYFLQLRNAIFNFHQEENDPIMGEIYLNEKLSDPKFKKESKKDETRQQYVWYVKEFSSRGVWHSNIKYNISIKPTEYAFIDLNLTGEVARLDLNPIVGYSAWIFRSNNPNNWVGEIRMPLIQDELSKILNVPLNEISMGIYSFKEKYVEEHCFSPKDVQASKLKLATLVQNQGYI